MADVVTILCSDGSVHYPRALVWAVGKVVQDSYTSAAAVPDLPLEHSLACVHVRCLFSAFLQDKIPGKIILSTADTLRALLAADVLQAEGMLPKLRHRLLTATDLNSEHLRVVSPTAVGLPSIASLLLSQRYDDQMVRSLLKWTSQGGTDFAAGLRCDVTRSSNMRLELPRLVQLIIDGDCVGTVSAKPRFF